MYNGIGLTTPRGSGTNGYVQRNIAFVKRAKERVDYKSEAELRKADELMFKEPNKEILEHERKRKIELKCAEMEDLMEEQGFSAEEIRQKVSNFRKFLAVEDEQNQKQQQEAAASTGKQIFPSVAKDAETGRLVAKGTHEIQAARQQQAELMRSALKIDRGRDAAASGSGAAGASALPYLHSESEDSDSDSDSESKKAKKAAKKAAKKERKDKEKKDKKKKKKAKRSKKDKEKEKEKEKEKKDRPSRRDRDRSRSPVSRSESRRK
uniref:Cwf21 domain-containing protein n=2 Tax=Macrostomum lignano TaxID=282301 RepID=A0A1I8I5U4_9PLAT